MPTLSPICILFVSLLLASGVNTADSPPDNSVSPPISKTANQDQEKRKKRREKFENRRALRKSQYFPFPVTTQSFDARRRKEAHLPEKIQKIVSEIEAMGYSFDATVYAGIPPEIGEQDLQYLQAVLNSCREYVANRPIAYRDEYRMLNNYALKPEMPDNIENHWAYKSHVELMEEYYKNYPDRTKPEIPKVIGNNIEYMDYIKLIDEFQRAAKNGAYPHSAAVYSQLADSPISLVILPPPSELQAFLDARPSTIRDSFGSPEGPWLKIQSPNDRLNYGMGVYFIRGSLTKNPTVPHGMPMLGMYGATRYEGQPSTQPANNMEKVIGNAATLDQAGTVLQIDKPSGAVPLGIITTLKLTEGIYFITRGQTDHEPTQYIAYPIADGNGGARADWSWLDYSKGGMMENRISSSIHDPRWGRHSLLKVPYPNQGIDENNSDNVFYYIQERFVLGPAHANPEPHIVILRKAPTWKPFNEDIHLDNRFSFSGKDENTARKVIIFTHAEPESLIKLIGALHNADMTELLSDTNKISKLKTLRPWKNR